MAARRASGAQSALAFIEGLSHPLVSELIRVRAAVLRASPGIVEEIKWNAPSYRIGDVDFATFHLRPRAAIQLVLHTGAKKRRSPLDMTPVKDPMALLAWRGTDRAIATIDDIDAQAEPLVRILRAWIKRLSL